MSSTEKLLLEPPLVLQKAWTTPFPRGCVTLLLLVIEQIEDCALPSLSKMTAANIAS